MFLIVTSTSCYSSQIFRHAEDDDDRVKAHVIAKCVFVKGRQVINPTEFLKDEAAIETGLVDAAHRSMSGDYNAEIIDCFEKLDEAKRKAATIIDGSRLRDR